MNPRRALELERAHRLRVERELRDALAALQAVEEHACEWADVGHADDPHASWYGRTILEVIGSGWSA